MAFFQRGPQLLPQSCIRADTSGDDQTVEATSANGATVSSPVKVVFGLEGMDVAPAGNEQDNSGHHHLLIDVDKLPSLDLPLVATDNFRHFGGGQTEVTLELPPGKHTLQLVLGDWIHLAHDPPVISKKITVTVKE